MNSKIRELQRKIDTAINKKQRMMVLSLLEELRVEQDKEEKALLQKKLGGSSSKAACDLILFLGSKYSNGIKGKLISALWDDWKTWPKYKSLLKKKDIYTLRRITPKDRGIKWGNSFKKEKSIYDLSLAPYGTVIKKK